MSATEQPTRGMTLPRRYYVDAAIFERDLERIFVPSWTYAGHASELRQPGDYQTIQIAGQSVVVVRGENGALRAFHNVCRHRGSLICTKASGQVTRALVCPHHGWSYGLDGSVLTAPRMPPGFDARPWGLKSAQVEEWHGLVFVSASLQPPEPVALQLAAIEEDVALYGIGKAKVARTILYDVAANWKLIMENYRECYHCQMNHPEFIHTVDISSQENDRRAQPKRYHPDYALADLPLRPGMRTQTISGDYACRRLLGGFARGGRDDRVIGLCWFTGTTMAWGPDHGTAFGLRPLGPTRTLVFSQWFVHEDAVEDVDYAVDDLIGLWDVTNRQDFELCRVNQLGVNSSAYEPGPYNLDMEDDVQQFVDAYLRMVGE
jgi:Rieske 2Fe-2S family protein